MVTAGVAGDWQLFLSANHLLPCAVKTSQRASPQLESAVDEGTSKRHFVSTPSHHADETSWPNLLQVRPGAVADLHALSNNILIDVLFIVNYVQV